MKKLKLLSLFSLGLLSLSACTNTRKFTTSSSGVSPTTKEVKEENTTSIYDDMTYEEAVSSFTPITVGGLYEMMEQDTRFLVYLGRESCSYCNILVPKIRQVQDELDIPIYYVNTEEGANDEELLKTFRDTYNVETVPNVSYLNGDFLWGTLPDGSQSTLEDIRFLFNEYLSQEGN